MTSLETMLLEEGDAPSKREILSKALTLFVRDGRCETSIRAIAEATGYTNPALYKFFASKEALELHLFERCYAWLFHSLTHGAQEGDFEARARAVVRAWHGAFEESPDGVLYVNETLRDFWPRVSRATARQSLLGFLGKLIEQGQREGVVSRRVTPPLGVAVLVGTLGQLSRQAYFGGAPIAASVVEEVLLAALSKRP
ncbi:MAG: TetR/AcrR family transcriptional regulator [Myxococcaceae bacterium]